MTSSFDYYRQIMRQWALNWRVTRLERHLAYAVYYRRMSRQATQLTLFTQPEVRR